MIIEGGDGFQERKTDQRERWAAGGFGSPENVRRADSSYFLSLGTGGGRVNGFRMQMLISADGDDDDDDALMLNARDLEINDSQIQCPMRRVELMEMRCNLCLSRKVKAPEHQTSRVTS